MLIGLVGHPSVGKSTFFKAATLAEVEIASYPFTTIKANEGVAYAKIECVEKELAGPEGECNPRYGFCFHGKNPKRFVPVEILDVAGLVPGASEGKGLGNQFLDDLREADVLIHVVDISGNTDLEGNPVEDFGADPAKDIEFLENELDRWYYGIMKKVWKPFVRRVDMQKNSKGQGNSGNENFSVSVANQFSGLKVKEDDVKEVLRENNFPERPSTWTEDQVFKFASELRKKSKPVIIAANKIDLGKGKENYDIIVKKFPDLNIVPCSAESELALRISSKKELIEYIPGENNFQITKKGKENLTNEQIDALNKIKKDIFEDEKLQDGTGVQEIINRGVFDLLKYVAVFPASANRLADQYGNVLPDVFLMPEGSTALDFAYKIHKDFGDNFIKAIDARTKKALGKDYELKHRDAVEIVSR